MRRQTVVKQKAHYFINRLKGTQKYLQCLYFKNSLEKIHHEYKLAQSLMKYSYGKVLAPPSLENTKALDKLTTTEEILEFFYNILDRTPRIKPFEGQTIPKTQRPLAFIGTDCTTKFSDLLHAIAKCRGQKSDNSREHHSQFFFATEYATEEQIFSFLVCAAQDLSGLYYFMIDLHKLRTSVSQVMIQQIKDIFFVTGTATKNYNLMLLTERKAALYKSCKRLLVISHFGRLQQQPRQQTSRDSSTASCKAKTPQWSNQSCLDSASQSIFCRVLKIKAFH